MANRLRDNSYNRGRSSAHGTGTGKLGAYSLGGGPRRRRFRLNAVNVTLAAVLVIAIAVIAVSLSSQGGPAGAGNPKTSMESLLTNTAPSGQTAMQSDKTSPNGNNASTDSATAGMSFSGSISSPSATALVTGFFTNGEVQIDYDNMIYESSDLYVKVTNVNEKGINYYVADCRMKDSSRLFRAFADDKYAMHTAEHTSVIAQRKGAVIAINGDYYGYRDQGIVIKNGQLYRDNPYYDVAAFYNDGTMKTFDKSEVTGEKFISDGATQTLCFGPMLLDGNGKAIEQSLLKKRPPLVNPANPRTGVGYIEPNHYVLVVVDGRGAGGSKGLTQYGFAQLFESLGCKCAYSLDGGGSATMAFMGKVINHPCDAGGERSVSDILYFGETESDQTNIDRINNQK